MLIYEEFMLNIQYVFYIGEFNCEFIQIFMKIHQDKISTMSEPICQITFKLQKIQPWTNCYKRNMFPWKIEKKNKSRKLSDGQRTEMAEWIQIQR